VAAGPGRSRPSFVSLLCWLVGSPMVGKCKAGAEVLSPMQTASAQQHRFDTLPGRLKVQRDIHVNMMSTVTVNMTVTGAITISSH